MNELTFLIHAARPQRQLEDDSTRSPRSKLRGNGRYSGDARCTPRPSCGGALAACPQPWDTVRRALGTLQSPRMLEASRWERVVMANHCMLNTTTVSVDNYRGPHTMSPRASVWGVHTLRRAALASSGRRRSGGMCDTESGMTKQAAGGRRRWAGASGVAPNLDRQPIICKPHVILWRDPIVHRCTATRLPIRQSILSKLSVPIHRHHSPHHQIRLNHRTPIPSRYARHRRQLPPAVQGHRE